MPILRALIVDDEIYARERFVRLLHEFPAIKVIGQAQHGQEALEFISRNKNVDVVFLDIEMPVLNGFETAAALTASSTVEQSLPYLVFVTAYNDYAIKAFETNAIDYLLKPVLKERLQTTIFRLVERASSKNKSSTLSSSDTSSLLNSAHVAHALLRELARKGQKNKLAVKSGQNYLVIQEDQISAIVACDNYAEILHGKKRTLVDETLENLEKRLSFEQFIRIHRSFLINLEYLQEIKRLGDRKYIAILNDYFSSEFSISRSKIDFLKSVLLK